MYAFDEWSPNKTRRVNVDSLILIQKRAFSFRAGCRMGFLARQVGSLSSVLVVLIHFTVYGYALWLHRPVNSPKVNERKCDKENLVIQLATSSDSWKRSFSYSQYSRSHKNKSFYYPIPEYCSEYLVINNWPNYKVDVRSNT